ncbi:MAG: LPS assembly lipoprotein LptE [Pseudomonadota bacterium]
MSLFDRRRICLAPFAIAVVGACGFEPVYAPGGSGDVLLNRVLVTEPDEVNEYLLVQTLEQRLGRATAPSYALAFDLEVENEGQGITQTGEITRFSILGRVDYELREIGVEEPFLTGNVQSFTGYSATGSTVETLAAERDALQRLMVILADRITAELVTTADLPE